VEQIVKTIYRMIPEAKRTQDSQLLADFKQSIETLRDLETAKLDTVTSQIILVPVLLYWLSSYIQRADEYANTKNEVLLCHKTEDIKYGLWVNISKNPRCFQPLLLHS
jgi:hypothetical protein